MHDLHHQASHLGDPAGILERTADRIAYPGRQRNPRHGVLGPRPRPGQALVETLHRRGETTVGVRKRNTHPAEIGHRVDVGPTSRHVLQQRHRTAGHEDVQRPVGQRHRRSAPEPTLGRTSSHPQARTETGPLRSVGQLGHVPPTVDRPHQPHGRVPATLQRHHRQGPRAPTGPEPAADPQRPQPRTLPEARRQRNVCAAELLCAHALQPSGPAREEKRDLDPTRSRQVIIRAMVSHDSIFPARRAPRAHCGCGRMFSASRWAYSVHADVICLMAGN